MFRVVILGSGRGSNARAVLEAEDKGQLGLAEVVGIFSDSETAGILWLGRHFEIPAFYLDPGPFKTKFSPEAEAHWVSTIKHLQPDLIVLAGFMRVLKTPFLEGFPDQIINLHPSLLPKHPGLHAIRKAWEAGDPETGCTVHWVSGVVDAGDIVAQKKVPVIPGESLEALEERVHQAEHKLLPATIRRIAEARLLGAEL